VAGRHFQQNSPSSFCKAARWFHIANGGLLLFVEEEGTAYENQDESGILYWGGRIAHASVKSILYLTL
jgi:hypothetical protein